MRGFVGINARGGAQGEMGCGPRPLLALSNLDPWRRDMQCSRNQAATVVLLLAVGLLSCRTAAIREPEIIRVPSGLTEDQVEQAIVLALAELPPGTIVLEHKASQVTDEILDRLFGADDPASWFVEARDSGVVFSGYQQDQHYLGVAIRYDTREVRVEIITSQNLMQSKSRIHKEVYVWIAALEVKIRQALGAISTQAG